MSSKVSGKASGSGVRARAALVVEQVLASKTQVSGALEIARSEVPQRDRGLLDELVLGTLRWLRRLDAVLEQAAGRPFGKIDRELLAPLRVAVYQLLFLDRVPDYAAVDAAVEEVKRRSHRGASGFANAVLRKIARKRSLADWPVAADDAIERLAIETSYPTFLAKRWVDRFGDAVAEAALEAGNRRPGYQLLCMDDRALVVESLRSESVETRGTPLSPNGLEVTKGDPRETEVFRAGRIYIQDQASQAAALVPGPAPGERVLDVAAAPGGKSFSLLAAQPDLELKAADASLPRILRMRANRIRLKRRVPLAVCRAEEACFRPRFDRVLVDLPCSGTGTFARHPELKWRLSESELERLSGHGLEMSLAAADMVSPGGRLCAITCSVEREENEDVVEEFLGRRPDYRLSRLDVSAALAPFVEAPGRWRVLPAGDHDGFTVHVLSRAR